MKRYRSVSGLTRDEKRKLIAYAVHTAESQCESNKNLASEAASLGYLAARLYVKKYGREKSDGIAMPKEVISAFVNDYISRQKQKNLISKPSEPGNGELFRILINEVRKAIRKIKDIILNNTVHL